MLLLLIIINLLLSVIISFLTVINKHNLDNILSYCMNKHPDFYKDISENYASDKFGRNFVLSSRLDRKSPSLPKDKHLLQQYDKHKKYKTWLYIASIIYVVLFAVQSFMAKYS